VKTAHLARPSKQLPLKPWLYVLPGNHSNVHRA